VVTGNHQPPSQGAWILQPEEYTDYIDEALHEMTRKQACTALRYIALLGLLTAIDARYAAGATYYVSAASPDPANVGGAGTAANPWVNLCNALTTHTFSPGDVIVLMAGRYRITTNGFNAGGCHPEGSGNGADMTVLPLTQTGTAANPIVIQNNAGDNVVIDGTTANAVTWTSCGGNNPEVYRATNLNFGSLRTTQVRYDQSGPTDAGTRLTWTGNGSCSGLARGQFSTPSGREINVRLADGSNPSNHMMLISGQQGDAAPYPIRAISSRDSYVTVRRNPAGGSFTVTSGYHCIYVDGGAHHLVFDGINVVGCGDSDYGNGVRVYNGTSVTFRNGLVSDAMAEGVAFYGGGPGCNTGNGCGFQTSNNVIGSSEIRNTGQAYLDGGGLNSNLGMGVIVKNCNNCTVSRNNIHHNVAIGIIVTTAQDANITSNGTIIDGNTIHDYGYECSNGCGGRTAAGILVVPQNSCSGGCTQNTLIQNNMIYNSEFQGHNGSENPYGITLDNGNQTDFVGTVIANNSFNNIVNTCLDFVYNRAVATFRNNVMTNCSTGSVASASWGAHVAVDADGSTPHVHSNNTYWTPNSSDVAVTLNGATTTRANVVSKYEASAVQVDPNYVGATTLKLQVGSALIDAGTPTNCPSADHEGSPRPMGLRCDIGAYEGTGAGAATPGVPLNLRINP
jgi:hypothetical protein